MTKRPQAQRERNPLIPGDTVGSDQTLRSSDVAFFFGAGASVEAGVPDTAGLLSDSVEPEHLLRSLRDFVKDRVMVKAENIKYLAPLRGFIDQYKPLNVFSANYDTAIEVLCAEHKLKYRDGFDEVWNPSVFDEPDIHVRLFKIHGSVTWYRTDRGRFVKIPTVVKGSRVELFTKEQA